MPHPSFVEGWDSAGSRARVFSLGPAVPKPIACTGDAITQPFRKVREKDGAPGLFTNLDPMARPRKHR